MTARVVTGAQWGDEGKGKIVDVFAEDSSIVARFQGGNNAGHTLVVRSSDGSLAKTVLHLIPSGILHPTMTNLICAGVAVDLDVFFEELDGLASRGYNVNPSQLKVDLNAHVTMPWHIALDKAREEARGDDKIGTTCRGIGPSYEDRAARRGIRVRDILCPTRLANALLRVLPEKNALLGYYGKPQMLSHLIFDRYRALADRLRPFVANTSEILSQSLSRYKRCNVLFEGAQGALLDVGYGTYPFVTSSHTSSAAVAIGTGIPASSVSEVVGVAKAYLTRVGGGPFPTELNGELGERLREAGAEFGATTGRPRRCGWFDVPIIRASHRLNGFTSLAITKLDVLTGLDTIKVCVAYDTPNGRVETADPDAIALGEVTPVYKEYPGWTEDISGARSIEELPNNAVGYLNRLMELTGINISTISVGPERDATISLQWTLK